MTTLFTLNNVTERSTNLAEAVDIEESAVWEPTCDAEGLIYHWRVLTIYTSYFVLLFFLCHQQK
jgi:hypothetical protein